MNNEAPPKKTIRVISFLILLPKTWITCLHYIYLLLIKWHSCFFHILCSISFSFVACVSGCHKFFEPYPSGNMFLVKIFWTIPRIFQRGWGTLAGLSAVTDFSVIYSTEHMRLSAVQHWIHSRAHNKSLLGFSKEHVHEIACWLRNHFPHLDPPLQIKSQKHICSWTLGISFDPQVLFLLTFSGR